MRLSEGLGAGNQAIGGIGGQGKEDRLGLFGTPSLLFLHVSSARLCFGAA